MPRPNIDTSRLQKLALDFYERSSKILDSSDSIQNAKVRGIQGFPITAKHLVELLQPQITAEDFFRQGQSTADPARPFF